MRKCAIVMLLAGLGAGSGAVAQIDPDLDGVGIYLDEGAMTYCTEAQAGGQVTAYLCLTRATAPAGIAAWEAKVEVSANGSVTAWSLRGQATNGAPPPEFSVTLAATLPWSSSIVVLEMTVEVLGVHPIGLRVGPVSSPSVPPDPFPLPAYAPADDPGNFRTLGYSFGWDPATGTPNWCAVINPAGDCSEDPAGGPDLTWGGIKALYR